MDPKVWGKLLTHHRRGYSVDVEALRDWFPLWRSTDEGSKMGSRRYRRLRQWIRFSWCSLMFSGYGSIYRRRKYVGGATGGPRGWGARQAPSWPPRLQLDVHSKSHRLRLFRKDRPRRFHSFWIPFDIPFLRNIEIGKNSNSGWASG